MKKTRILLMLALCHREGSGVVSRWACHDAATAVAGGRSECNLICWRWAGLCDRPWFMLFERDCVWEKTLVFTQKTKFTRDHIPERRFQPEPKWALIYPISGNLELTQADKRGAKIQFDETKIFFWVQMVQKLVLMHIHEYVSSWQE